MELDELKTAWRRMESELDRQQEITASLLAERTQSRIQASLKPLLNWQVFQIVVGVVLAILGARFWIPRTDQAVLLLSGLVVHAYGIALIINGAWVVSRLKEIDYGESITNMQKRIARLERSYVISGWVLGLPWWLLWIPTSLVVVTWAGFDIAGDSLVNWISANAFVGVVGMILTVLGVRWAERSSRPEVRERFERIAIGASIHRAKQALADIDRFENPAG